MKVTTGKKSLNCQRCMELCDCSSRPIYFRILHTTVTADYETSNRKDCALTLKYDFPADIYVDKYELATIALNRKVSNLSNIIIFRNNKLTIHFFRWNFILTTNSSM